MTARAGAGYDVIVIGGGANGLVAAAALGRAGRRVLLLERGDALGGQSRASEFAPGFRASPSSTDAGWLPPAVTRGLGLAPLPTVAPEIAVAAAAGDGGWLALPADPARAAAAIRPHSPRDADRWGGFSDRLRKLAGFLEALYELPPPDIDTSAFADLTPLLGLGRRFRALGRTDMTELLRVLPMPVHDLLDDWFESRPLKAAVAAGGVRDIRQGPRSGGTSFVLLHYMVGAAAASVRTRPWWRDGPDAFATAAEAVARASGVAIRTGAAAAVARIVVRDDAVAGVMLAGGEEIAAPVVVSTADPARTLLQLVDPVWLDPEFLEAVRHIKFRGCTATVHYAVDALPGAPGLPRDALAGVVSLTSSVDALERAYDAAKYGQLSEAPHVELTVPTLRWPGLAPAGKHVVVARVQYAPYRLRDGAVWDAARAGALADAVTGAIERAMPRFAASILHRAVVTPRELAERFDLTEGAVTHGELTLDQILFMRPVAGWGRHAMPVEGLYLGGAGAHPGPGVTGGPGWLAAKRVQADAARSRHGGGSR